jgi:hypothetical protein
MVGPRGGLNPDTPEISSVPKRGPFAIPSLLSPTGAARRARPLAAVHPAQEYVEFRCIAESAVDDANGRPNGAELRLSLGDSFRRVVAVFPVGSGAALAASLSTRPVLPPSCIRHRPFAIAGPLQFPPARVRAPHRGADEKSPGGLP